MPPDTQMPNAVAVTHVSHFQHGDIGPLDGVVVTPSWCMPVGVGLNTLAVRTISPDIHCFASPVSSIEVHIPESRCAFWHSNYHPPFDSQTLGLWAFIILPDWLMSGIVVRSPDSHPQTQIRDWLYTTTLTVPPSHGLQK